MAEDRKLVYKLVHLAERLGCRYLSRPDNLHAKAGNLNAALPRTDGQFIAVLDADTVPQPDFLDKTLGYFQDERVALVQLPQEFYNADSVQHAGGQSDSEDWHDQALFFRVIQRGQGDELHALRERLDKLRRHLQRQAGFAHPCAPRQGEQVYLGTLEQRAHCPHLLLSPDQGGGRYGKLAPANRRSISKRQAPCQPRFPPGQLPPSALIWRQMQRLGQQVQGLLVWSAGQPALQNADGIRADARTRGQFFLGQPGCAAGVPQ